MNATVKRFIQERNSIKSIFRGAKNSRVSIRGTKRSCRILTLKFHEEIFTKVTPPLGSRALRRWGSSPHARTKNKTICLWQMVLFLGSAPCGRSTPRGSNMPGASELPLRQDFAAQNTCDGAPVPPRRVGAWFGRRPYCCIMARRNGTHARFTALQQHITVLLQMPKTPLL